MPNQHILLAVCGDWLPAILLWHVQHHKGVFHDWWQRSVTGALEMLHFTSLFLLLSELNEVSMYNFGEFSDFFHQARLI
jgi:hypothetical protein